MTLCNTPRLRGVCVLLGAMLLAGTPLAIAATRSLPPSMLPETLPLDRVELQEMSQVDTAALLAEDARRERAGVPVPTRYATIQPAAFSPDGSGTWEELADGSRLWRLRIVSPGALSLSLGLSRFELPEGAALWIHDPDGAQVQGPYTSADRNTDGGLWTAMVLGDEVVAELQLPAGVQREPILEISSINHGYRIFGEPHAEAGLKRGVCNVNVVCPEGDRWRDQIRSVARIVFTSGFDAFACTAQLVNNTAEDNTPYLLTAQHCIDAPEVAPTIVAYWNYQTASCDDISGGSLADNQSGATFVASSPYDTGSDFALVELDEQPDADFDVYFAGWDARETPPQSSVCLHHPNGDEKSISYDFEPATVTSYLENTSPGNGNYLRVADWDVGTTEVGSSGACLFDEASGLCVGTLSGGYAACGNDQPDWFGRFSRQYTGGGTPETRLSDWVDPLGTGALLMLGKNQVENSTSSTWLIPAVASVPGVDRSSWKTQIAVANPGTESVNVEVYFVASDETWPGTLLGGPYLVGPYGSLSLDDPLVSLNPTSGLIYLTVNGPGSAVSSRTYTPTEGGGTVGQGIPGILLDSASSSSELILPLINSGPSTFRTNVGFAQTSAGSITAEVSVFAPDGELLGQKRYRIETAWRQVNDIFENMGIGNLTVEGGWIRVRLVRGSPVYWTTYASVID
ncbi:MAG: trypsin-like peptidase domain-containing protein, partial [Acidobacteriota bacterium]